MGEIATGDMRHTKKLGWGIVWEKGNMLDIIGLTNGVKLLVCISRNITLSTELESRCSHMQLQIFWKFKENAKPQLVNIKRVVIRVVCFFNLELGFRVARLT